MILTGLFLAAPVAASLIVGIGGFLPRTDLPTPTEPDPPLSPTERQRCNQTADQISEIAGRSHIPTWQSKAETISFAGPCPSCGADTEWTQTRNQLEYQLECPCTLPDAQFAERDAVITEVQDILPAK